MIQYIGLYIVQYLGQKVETCTSKEMTSKNNTSMYSVHVEAGDKWVWYRKLFSGFQMLLLRLTNPFSQAARSQGVDCLVAPYEADAQLAYLNKAGIVQAVITEDSDLLAFGCKKVPNINQGAEVFFNLI